MISQQFRRGVLLAFVACVLSLPGTPVVAQDQPPRERKNSVYGEIFGVTHFFSINYERMLTSRISARVGGPATLDKNLNDFSIGAPDYPDPYALVLASNVVVAGHRRRHQFTAGAGVLLLHVRFHYFDEPYPATVFGEIGYRYNAKSGFLFKGTLAYLFRDIDDQPAGLAPGVSLGWSF